jgi:hypothetical protein
MAKDKGSSKAAASSSAAADGGASKKRKRAESADGGAKAAKAKSTFELVDGAATVDAAKLEGDDVELVLIRVPAAVSVAFWTARAGARRSSTLPRARGMSTMWGAALTALVPCPPFSTPAPAV